MTEQIVIWSNIWKWTILLGSAAFAVLLVYTLFHGAVDIVRLLRALKRQAAEGKEESLH